MRIRVKNLGVIKQAEMELGKLTIINGSNNSGKTYVTYAIFGFLDFWHNEFQYPIDIDFVKTLNLNGSVSINLTEQVKKASNVIANACKEYTKKLSRVFAAQTKLFENSSFEIDIENEEVMIPDGSYDQEIRTRSGKNAIFTLKKEENHNEIIVTLLSDEDDMVLPTIIIQNTIGDFVRRILFDNILPFAFIASAERTGATIFRKELDFARNRLLKRLGRDEGIDPIKLLKKERSDYALPVEMNVDYARDFESLSKNASYISKNFSEILEKFSTIIGGDYQVSKNNELHFVPKNAKVKLTMDESSSAVRSLSLIGFYLRHSANKDDLLIIDEPELNLHPENQRKVARLIAALVNSGIKVFITTHSDYIIKELNTLIMLNSEKKYIKNIMEEEGYSNKELLNIEDIRVYVASESLIKLESNTRARKYQTMIPAPINIEQGIEVFSFDQSIEEMNRIQENILFGGE
ncbi:MAG: hypothetical protein K0R00_1549 [Herbinix sp.]|jgi:predicted ATPase|nr:hypothetical protein [Herbinix sp.]